MIDCAAEAGVRDGELAMALTGYRPKRMNSLRRISSNRKKSGSVKEKTGRGRKSGIQEAIAAVILRNPKGMTLKIE